MAFFTPSDPDASPAPPVKSSEIPPEILGAVRIMGDAPVKARVSEAASAPRSGSGMGVPSNVPSTSPFLPSLPDEPALRSQDDIMTGGKVESYQPPAPSRYGFQPAFTGPEDRIVEFRPIRSRAALWGGALLCLVLLLGGALWYFFIKLPADRAMVAPTPVVEAPSEEPKTDVVLPYAVDKPNFLSIDTETFGPADFERLTNEAAAKIAAASITTPVEFLMTDKNNNPIAFIRVAFMLKLSMPDAVLSQIEEPFSLYVTHQNGAPRLGAVLTLKKPVDALPAIAKHEAVLPAAFQPLLFGSAATAPQRAVFRSGSYLGEAVRYVNLDEAKGLSFDYVFRGQSWFIGSSQATLRAILDAKK